MTIAFVYKWTQLSTGMWYIGSRTAKGCHPDDGYICSSKFVKPLIKANTNDWERTILFIDEPEKILEKEVKLLNKLDAKNHVLSYNKTNGGFDFYGGSRMTGKTYEEMYGIEKASFLKNKRRLAKQNKTFTQLYGEEKAKEAANKISESKKNKTYEEQFGKDKAEQLRTNHSKRLKGKPSTRKGKSYEEIYGSEKAKEMKQNRKGRTWEEIFGVEKAQQMKQDRRNAMLGKTYAELRNKI
jgi:hypothetical protein